MEMEKRPRVLGGKTIKRRTGCGNLYIIVNSNGGEIIEVFAKLGKAGGCATCQLEALTRCITLGLKFGVPVAEIVNELKELRCPNPDITPEGSLSCPDAIARALVEREPPLMEERGFEDRF